MKTKKRLIMIYDTASSKNKVLISVLLNQF